MFREWFEPRVTNGEHIDQRQEADVGRQSIKLAKSPRPRLESDRDLRWVGSQGSTLREIKLVSPMDGMLDR